jgi:CBS domain-containing protein
MVQIKNIMAKKEELAVCSLDTTLEQVVSILTTRNVGSVLIQKDELVFAGIVTTNDVLEAYGSGLSKDTEVYRIMAKKIESVNEEDDIAEASKKMIEASCHHLLVRNKLGIASGLISTYDITKAIAQESLSTYPFLESLFDLQSRKKIELENWISEKTTNISESIETTISNAYESVISKFEQ